MNADHMRRNAEHCLRLAEETADQTQRQRYLRAARAWMAVASNKDRLDNALIPEEAPVLAAVEEVA
jgi:hypothetical protein